MKGTKMKSGFSAHNFVSCSIINIDLNGNFNYVLPELYKRENNFYLGTFLSI